MQHYDYIIIGAGIAGLYAFQKLNSNNNVLVLEASNHVGGRMGQEMFYGTSVSIGAGIGRKSKDKLLQKLLKHHHITTHDFTIEKQWLTDMQEPESHTIIQRLKHNYSNADKNSTFREYGIKQLGVSLYNRFMKHYEYTDMEKADAYETLFHYGLEDNSNGWIGISIPWNQLLEKMTPPTRNIKYNCPAYSIQHSDNSTWLINDKYHTQNVILATTSDVVKTLLPTYKSIYKQVDSQPFIRIYGKFSAGCSRLMPKTSVIVNNQIKRIIPMSDTVYMIVYSDNANALYIKKHVTGNNPESRQWLCRKLEQALNLPTESLTLTGIKNYFWNEGTHYYKPHFNYSEWIRHAQNPEPGLYVVGEMVSRDQGWVEGALQSIEHIL